MNYRFIFSGAFGPSFLCRFQIAGSAAQNYSEQHSSTSNAEGTTKEGKSDRQSFTLYPIYGTSIQLPSLFLSLQHSSGIRFPFFIKDLN